MPSRPGNWERDIESAEERAAIAAAYKAAIDLAIQQCGPGAIAYAAWVITDKTGVLPTRKIYCCRREGQLGWQPRYEDSEERLTSSHHPGYEFGGKRLFPFRFQVGFSALSQYHPETAEQLAGRRAKKASKELEVVKRKSRDLLFPEVLLDEITRLEKLTI